MKEPRNIVTLSVCVLEPKSLFLEIFFGGKPGALS